MDAVPEREVPTGVAPDIQPVRVGEAVRIAVRAAQRQQDRGALRDRDARDRDVLDREPPDRQRRRRFVAQQLLHGRRQQRGFGPYRVEQVGVGEQRHDPGTDEVDHVLVAREQQQERQRRQLVGGEPVGTVAQRGQHVVAGPFAGGRDQLLEVRVQLADREGRG